MELIGSTHGNIRILERLGLGGMGEVYVGFDEKLERRVAVKTIRRDWTAEPAIRQRFLQEAQILSRLDHPNICRIFDYIEGDEVDLLVLELIDGEPLDVVIHAGLSDLRRSRTGRSSRPPSAPTRPSSKG